MKYGLFGRKRSKDILLAVSLVAIVLTFPLLLFSLQTQQRTETRAATLSPTPTPQGSQIQSLPLISNGLPAFTNDNCSGSFPATNANDGSYDTVWSAGCLNTSNNFSTPVYLAYDLSSVPMASRTNVILVWWSACSQPDNTWSSCGAYNSTIGPSAAYDVPGTYTIDANSSPGGASSAPQTGWTTLITISNNTYHSRQHLLNLSGYNWIRINVTQSSSSAPNFGVALNMDLHTVANGLSDDWIFYGDSITEGGLENDTLNGVPSFSQLLNSAVSTNYPIVEDGGIGGQTTTTALTYIDAQLSLFPGKYVGLAFGTNDEFSMSASTFYSNYVSLVQKVLNAGKIPVVPTIPWKCSNANIPLFNQQIQNLYTAFPQIIHGPDLYTYFFNNQNLLVDCIHPSTPNGMAAYRQLWANAMLANVYQVLISPTTPTVTNNPPSPTPGIVTGGCKYLTNPSATSAFCDDFSEGVSPGGRAGDLDERRWSVGRILQGRSTQTPSTDLFTFPSTPVEPCKSGVSSVNPDNDIIMCDSASGHLGQIEMGLNAQNYGLLSIRPRQIFDFTNRTGTITYNTDAITNSGLGFWTSIFFTDDPVPAANNSAQVQGILPKNGWGINFDGNNCPLNTNDQQLQTRINQVYVYTNYVEANIPVNNGVCINTQRGSLNHIEIQVSQNQISVYGSDFSTDNGVSFPNFRLIGSATVNLPITRGYLHFQQGLRAGNKYVGLGQITPPPYANNYWSNIGFDGPATTSEIGYMVPDSLTINPNPADAGGPAGALNIGYGLLTNPYSTYSCCNSSGQSTTVGPFTLTNVTPASSNILTFMVNFPYGGSLTPQTAALHYRLNGGSWLDPNPQPNYAAEEVCSGCPGAPIGGWGVLYSFPVTGLVQGTNTIEFGVDNSNNGVPPVISSIELLTFGGTSPTNTPIPPTSTPQPSSTQLQLSLKLHALGDGGDVVTPNGTGNINPVHTHRSITVSLYAPGSTTPTTQVNWYVDYQGQNPVGSRNFTGTMTLPSSVATGSYTMQITSPGYLSTRTSSPVSITLGQVASIPTLSLLCGDVDNNNILDIRDYNIILNAFGSIIPSTNPLPTADINDDGRVDISDLNTLLREFSLQRGI